VLLQDGSYDRHVRRMRRLQQARQGALTDALAKHLGDRMRIQGAASGLHLVAWIPGLPASAEPALVQAARERGVRVYPVGALYLPARARPRGAMQRPAGLVMGYALLGADAIKEGVRRLESALSTVEG